MKNDGEKERTDKEIVNDGEKELMKERVLE